MWSSATNSFSTKQRSDWDVGKGVVMNSVICHCTYLYTCCICWMTPVELIFMKIFLFLLPHTLSFV
jgi:hypothetical protein